MHWIWGTAVLFDAESEESVEGIKIPVECTFTLCGVLRDMFCKRIPLVFQKELYAGVSFASAVLYIALQHYVSNHDVVIISTLVFGFFARLLALRLKLGLPVFYYSHEGH